MRSWLFAYAAIVFCAGGYLLRHPENNWDMIPYTAAVVSTAVHDPAAIHAETYRLVAAVVPAERMQQLEAPGYMQAVAESPRSLLEQLPFYRIRPAYLLAVGALSALGVNPARAMLLLSVAAYAGLCLIVWLWFAGLTTGLRFACSALVAVSEPMLHIAGLGNPDALSTLLVVSAFYLFVVHARAGAAMLLMLASILVRSDNVFLCALFAGSIAWRERRAAPRAWLAPAAVAVAGIAWVAAWHHHVGNYGWRLTMYHSFLNPLPLPSEGVPYLSRTQLAKMWIGGLASLRQSSLSASLLLFVCAFALLRHAGWPRQARHAALVMIASIVVHAAIFPNLEDRFFVAQFVVITVVSASSLIRWAMAARSTETQPVASRIHVRAC